MIDSNFNTADTHNVLPREIMGTYTGGYLPNAKLGYDNYIYVYRGGTLSGQRNPPDLNYFGLLAIYDSAAYFGNGKYLSSVSIPCRRLMPSTAK
jgi:hypothetical protein